MDVKRYFRGPVMWIVLAVLAVVVLMQVVGSSGGYKTVDTGQVVKAITDNKVKSAELTTGDENKIKVELSGDNKVDGSNKLQASYIGDQGVDLAKTLQARYQTGEIKDGYTVSPSKQNPFVGMLISLLPFVLIVVIFLFLMNQMQGGGSRVMNFGKSKAKLITKDTPKTTFSDVAARTRPSRSSRRSRSSSRSRPSSRPSAPRSQGCAAVRPARYGQDAARACRRRRGGRAVLLDLRLRLRRDVRGCRCLPGP